MKKLSQNIVKGFSNKIDLRTFQKTVSQEELKKYLDPYGFLKEDEWNQYLIDSGRTTRNKETEDSEKDPISIDDSLQKNTNLSTNQSYAQNLNNVPEYGFKVKGLEPTRYGDWERKGKCVDF